MGNLGGAETSSGEVRGRLARWAWLLAAVPLLPVLGLGFFNDDYFGLVLFGRHGWTAVLDQFHPTAFEFLRPISFAFFQLELSLFGPHPLPFHAVHFALFVLAAWLTGRLAARLGAPEAAAWATALALLYPGRLETVAWIAAVFDLLALVAVVGVLLLVLSPAWADRALQPWLVGVACLLAPLTKESAYALPLVVLAWEAIGVTPGPGHRRRARAIAAVVGTAAALAVRAVALGGVGGYRGTSAAGALRRLADLPELLARAVVVPVNPSFGTVSTVVTAACAVALVVAVVLALRPRTSPPLRPLAAAAVLLVVGPLPALPYLDPAHGATWTNSRNLALLGLGVALLVALLLAPLGRRRLVTGGVVLAAWAAATGLNLTAWVQSARARDAILTTIEADTRTGLPVSLWVAGPIERRHGAQLLGGHLAEAVALTLPGRAIAVDSEFAQIAAKSAVGPRPAPPGVRALNYRFDPTPPALVPLP